MYCTQEEVLQFTGIDCTDVDIMQASADIAMIVGTPLVLNEEDRISDRDEEVLMMATIMQVAWIKDNAPGQYSNSDVTSYSQDGESSNLNPTAVVLSPRSRMWINNLSWMKSRKANLPGSYPLLSTFDTFYAGVGWTADVTYLTDRR